MKDEYDLRADIEWLLVQEEFLKHWAERIQKEVSILIKYRGLREEQLEKLKKRKK